MVEQLIEHSVSNDCPAPPNGAGRERYTSVRKRPAELGLSQIPVDWCHGRATPPQWIAIAPEMAHTLVSEGLFSV